MGLFDCLKKAAKEPDRPGRSAAPTLFGQMALWYPKAKIMEPGMPTRGNYRKGYPEGAVIHYTASGESIGDMDYGRTMGWCFFFIARDGRLWQPCPLNRYGWHAGASYWPGLGDSVSSKLVGIEVDSAGRLDAGYKSWYGETFTDKDVRVVPTATANIWPGAYHTFTDAQEAALVELLVWLKLNNPDVFDLDLVLGHDEVSPVRKTDPGGSLSSTMPEFRKRLKAEYARCESGGDCVV